jgi:seryl-tRNA synthetase
MPEMDLAAIPGCRWHPSGQTAFSGPALRLFRRLDALFLEWAAESSAAEHHFPTFIAAAALHRLDYFRSFPHLVTFPVSLDPEEANLRAFTGGQPVGPQGEIQLARAAPIRDVLTPAACYHFYAHHQGARLEAPLFLTTRGTCFRREAHYAPLSRQWSFSMREIVCIGTSGEVQAFLERCREKVAAFVHRVGLALEWKPATDPFFDPTRNAKYVMQKIEPIKTEMVFGGDLAIGSVNYHRRHFGAAFDIRRSGEEASSGCVAFGLERWMLAFASTFGADESRWPLPELRS